MSTKRTRKKRQAATENHLAVEREALLARALVHVPFDGWTETSLRAAAADLNYDWSMARRVFPRGVRDLIGFFDVDVDRRMVAAFDDMDLESLRIRERIVATVRKRLEICMPHREACGRLIAYYALPGNAVAGLRVMYRSVDLMWRAAGDTATDFNFYSKRGLLAGVYSSTILFWLYDRSEDCADSWAFLDRRIANVMEIQKTRGRLEQGVEALGRVLRRGPIGLRRQRASRALG